jgi:hypothetical protein
MPSSLLTGVRLCCISNAAKGHLASVHTYVCAINHPRPIHSTVASPSLVETECHSDMPTLARYKLSGDTHPIVWPSGFSKYRG